MSRKLLHKYSVKMFCFLQLFIVGKKKELLKIVKYIFSHYHKSIHTNVGNFYFLPLQEKN